MESVIAVALAAPGALLDEATAVALESPQTSSRCLGPRHHRLHMASMILLINLVAGPITV